MGTTGSYGYYIPASNDTGDVFFPNMAANMTQLNNHNHDGVTSAPLASTQATISHSNWLAAPVGGGIYYQTVTVPTGLNFDTCQIWFKLSSNQYVYPSIERVSSTTYNVFTSDNTLDYIANYR